MFAYCKNDPVNRSDPSGEWAQLVVGTIVGAVIGGASAAFSSWKESGSVDFKSVLLGAGIGAVNGLIGASGLRMFTQAVTSGVLSGASSIASNLMNGEDVDWINAGIDAGIGIISSVIGSVSTAKAAQTAKNTIERGISKIESGLAKRNAGSRYWKGAVKKGVNLFRTGVQIRNAARGRASVNSSISGGIMSIAKSIIK